MSSPGILVPRDKQDQHCEKEDRQVHAMKPVLARALKDRHMEMLKEHDEKTHETA